VDAADRGGLVDQQVNMLRHQDVCVNSGQMPLSDLLQYGSNGIPGRCRFEESIAVKAAERDEVERFRSLEPL